MSYGIALDIGTTTVSGSLINLETRRTEKKFSSLNSQVSYGHDLITRIGYALRKKEGLRRLNESVLSSVNLVIKNLTCDFTPGNEKVDSIVAVCNSVMYHFFLSLPVDTFAKPPYSPLEADRVKSRAGKFGIEGFPEAQFTMLPNVGGFIGSDTIAFILATGLHKNKYPTLAVDIGTNGEIVLGSADEILALSTAAGPAFESWHINCGMRPLVGAIKSAEYKNEQINLNVVGGTEPKGISGSGLIDLIGILLRRGEIDKTGKLKKDDFTVHDGINVIKITQQDIREVQLAKAAFFTGIKFLRSRSSQNIEKLYITGTFGNYISKENAQLIGLIPNDIPHDRIEFVNEGALTGAEMVLLNPDLENDIKDILKKIKHVELAKDKNFQSEFASAMFF